MDQKRLRSASACWDTEPHPKRCTGVSVQEIVPASEHDYVSESDDLGPDPYDYVE
jgi:hypothetical protein